MECNVNPGVGGTVSLEAVPVFIFFNKRTKTLCVWQLVGKNLLAWFSDAPYMMMAILVTQPRLASIKIDNPSLSFFLPGKI